MILVFPRRFPRVYSSGVEKQKLEAPKIRTDFKNETFGNNLLLNILVDKEGFEIKKIFL